MDAVLLSTSLPPPGRMDFCQQQRVGQVFLGAGSWRNATLRGLAGPEAAPASPTLSWKLKGRTAPVFACHVLVFPGEEKSCSHVSAHPSLTCALQICSPEHEPGAASLCPTWKFYFFSCFRHKQPSPSCGFD